MGAAADGGRPHRAAWPRDDERLLWEPSGRREARRFPKPEQESNSSPALPSSPLVRQSRGLKRSGAEIFVPRARPYSSLAVIRLKDEPGRLSTARSTTCGLRGRHSRSLPSLRTAPHGFCGKGTRCPSGSSSDVCRLDRQLSLIPRRFGSVASEHTGRRRFVCSATLETFLAAGVYSTRVVGSGARPEPQSGARRLSPPLFNGSISAHALDERLDRRNRAD